MNQGLDGKVIKGATFYRLEPSVIRKVPAELFFVDNLLVLVLDGRKYEVWRPLGLEVFRSTTKLPMLAVGVDCGR